MERLIQDRNILDDLCQRFCSIIEKYVSYIVVSGFVAIASGRTRGTEDIDLICQRMEPIIFQKFFTELESSGFVCMQTSNPQNAYEYLAEGLSLRFTLKEKILPEMEVKFAQDRLDEYQLQTKTKLTLTGLDIWFSNVNVNIAFKEELLKSPKDIEDAQHLRIVYTEKIDEKEIDLVKKMIRACRL